MANFEQSDLQKNRALGGLGYLIFFLPLIACPESRYGRHCANQGLIFWIFWVAYGIVFSLLSNLFWIPVVGFLFQAVLWLCWFAVLALEIYYTVLAVSKGDAREIPFVGSYRIIK